MARRSNLVPLTQIVAIRRAESAKYHADRLEAVRLCDAAREAREQADRATAGAFSDWRTELARPRFAPELERDLGRLLTQFAEAGAQATDTEKSAQGRLDLASEALAAGEARLEQAKRVVGVARRAAARKREEERAHILADRIAQQWRSQ